MIAKFSLRLIGLCCVLAAPVYSPAWAADAATGKEAIPPDLTGVWTRPIEKGFAFPNELPAVMRSLARTDTAKAKMGSYAKLVPPNPTGPMDSPGAYCLGAAMPTMALLPGGYPMEIIQRPEQITFLYELDGGVRRIFLKSKIAPNDLIPARAGTSTGRWEGDTLVVETSALTDTFDGDQVFPHGEQATIVERYRMSTDAKGNKFLAIDLTMTDPESYAKPVQISQTLSLMPNGRILPYACEMWDQRLESLRAKVKASDK